MQATTAKNPGLSWLLWFQASINELEVVIDESNVQISSLREQLSAAQQTLDASEAEAGTLQSTVASLQQEVQTAQVCFWPLPICRMQCWLQCCNDSRKDSSGMMRTTAMNTSSGKQPYWWLSAVQLVMRQVYAEQDLCLQSGLR